MDKQDRDEINRIERILRGIVRVGTVTDVNNSKHLARVKFQSEDMTSAWLHVLDNRPFIPGYDQTQQTESRSGGSGAAAFAAHTHDLVIKQWMPKINDTVVCLYLPVFNADGFILGGVG